MHTLKWTYANTFWVRLATSFSRRKNQFEKFKNTKRTHPLTKLNKNKSYYVDKYLGFIWINAKVVQDVVQHAGL
jgi:hypothetical protein